MCGYDLLAGCVLHPQVLPPRSYGIDVVGVDVGGGGDSRGRRRWRSQVGHSSEVDSETLGHAQYVARLARRATSRLVRAAWMSRLLVNHSPFVPAGLSHYPLAWSSRRVRGGWPGCPSARSPGLARGWAAGRRTGRGPRPSSAGVSVRAVTANPGPDVLGSPLGCPTDHIGASSF